MSTDVKPNKKKYETVSLKKEVSEKLDKLMKNIEGNTSNIKVSRGQMVNYLLLRAPVNFKKKDYKDIEVSFYDLENILSEAKKKIKEIKKQGGIVSLADVLPEALLKKPRSSNSAKSTKVSIKKTNADEAATDTKTHSGGDFKEDITDDLNQNN